MPRGAWTAHAAAVAALFCAAPASRRVVAPTLAVLCALHHAGLVGFVGVFVARAIRTRNRVACDLVLVALVAAAVYCYKAAPAVLVLAVYEVGCNAAVADWMKRVMDDELVILKRAKFRGRAEAHLALCEAQVAWMHGARMRLQFGVCAPPAVRERARSFAGRETPAAARARAWSM